MPHCNKQNFLAGVDCRARRTACCCLKSLRIRIGARANVTEREVTSLVLFLVLCVLCFFVLFGVVFGALVCFVLFCVLDDRDSIQDYVDSTSLLLRPLYRDGLRMT